MVRWRLIERCAGDRAPSSLLTVAALFGRVLDTGDPARPGRPGGSPRGHCAGHLEEGQDVGAIAVVRRARGIRLLSFSGSLGRDDVAPDGGDTALRFLGNDAVTSGIDRIQSCGPVFSGLAKCELAIWCSSQCLTSGGAVLICSGLSVMPTVGASPASDLSETSSKHLNDRR
jgi:hypothetical protein